MHNSARLLIPIILLLAGCRTGAEIRDFDYQMTITNVKEEDLSRIESVLRVFDEEATLAYSPEDPLADMPDELTDSNLPLVGAARTAGVRTEVLTEGVATATVRLRSFADINALHDDLTSLDKPRLHLEHSRARIEQGYYTGEAKGRGLVLVYGNVSSAASSLADRQSVGRSLNIEGEDIPLEANGSFAFWYLFKSGRSQASGKLTVGELKYDVSIGADGVVRID